MPGKGEVCGNVKPEHSIIQRIYASVFLGKERAGETRIRLMLLLLHEIRRSLTLRAAVFCLSKDATQER